MRFKFWKSRSDESTNGGGGKNGQRVGEDVVIAVMGITGAGKSSFIATATGQSHIHVGHDLNSDTTDVAAYRLLHKSTNYVLIDTPGFDDSRMTNEDVIQRLTEWLASSYRQGTRLNGIIFVHNISKPRVQGSAYQFMRLFRRLCGDGALGNVTLATSFWDQVSPEIGEKREEELKREFWAPMLAKGSNIIRLKQERMLSLEILEQIALKGSVGLLVQKEMVEQGKSFQDTTAGQSEEAKEIQAFERKLAAEKEAEKRRLQKLQEQQAKEQKKAIKRVEKERRKRESEERWAQFQAEREHERQLRRDERQRQEERAALQQRLRRIEEQQERERQQARYYSDMRRRERERQREVERQRERERQRWMYYCYSCGNYHYH